MLKGIKKSRPNEEQISVNTKEDFKKQSKAIIEGWANDGVNEIRDQQIKIFTSSKNTLKEQFMVEEQVYVQEKTLQNQAHFSNHQQDSIHQLKTKALEIMELYKSGNINQLESQLQKFQKLQKTYFSRQNTQKRPYKPGQYNPTQQIIPQSNQQQQKKGRFEYNFNYEQSEQQDTSNKINSRKRNQKSRPIMKSNKIQDYCIYCPDNQQLRLVSASNYVYLAIPKRKTFHKYWHFILAPVEHQQTSIGLNEDVLTELSNYKKCLLQMFDKKNYLVVFWEQFSQENSHIYIECLAVPHSKGQDFPFFFKQSLQTIQGNWTTHQSLIKIDKEKGGIQRQIPKKINYFYIDFSLGYGYAHVIENTKFWKRQFVYDIIATAIGLQLYQVKTAAQFFDQQLNAKQTEFKKIWESYDWTKCL